MDKTIATLQEPFRENPENTEREGEIWEGRILSCLNNFEWKNRYTS
jgi:hypothetical protein